MTLRLRRSNRLHLHRRLKPALPIVLVLSAAVLVIASYVLAGVSLRRSGVTDYDYEHEHEHEQFSPK